MKPNPSMLKRLTSFVLERQRIYTRRQEGKPKPWTTDPILQQYKFCNVYREQDRVTIWIDQHIRRPYKDDANLWFMLCVARQLNWPDTLQELMDAGAWPTARRGYNAVDMTKVLLTRKARGDKVYTGAYMISGQRGRKEGGGKNKPWMTCHLVLQSLWRDRPLFIDGLTTRGVTLAAAHAALVRYRGWGDFLAAQVVADLKHTRYLRRAADWYTWAVLGPGSTRGLNRLYPQRRRSTRRSPLKAPWPVEESEIALRAVRVALSRALVQAKLGPPLCAQDTQNCLCEFDKYERARLGQGRPRALYDGGAP